MSIEPTAPQGDLFSDSEAAENSQAAEVKTVETSSESRSTVSDSNDRIVDALVEKAYSLDASVEKVDFDIHGNFSPWSFSKYKSLKKCPFQFYLKYLVKLKVPETLLIQNDPVSANVGKAAHAILEDIVVGKDRAKTIAKVKAEYIKSGQLSEESWKKVDALEYNIVKFQERIEAFNLKTPVKRIFTEIRMGLNKDYEPTGFFSEDVWIRGVIDLVLMLECEDAVILDHKTGGGQGSIRNYEEQLDWYKFLLHLGVARVAGAQTGIHFIGEGEVKMASYSSKDQIEGTIKNSIEMSLEGAIEALVQIGYFKHIRGSYCKWCEYDNLGCKSGKLKPLELNTKRWFQIHKA